MTGGATAPPARPADRHRRIVGVDAARGLALLGMMAAHVVTLRVAGGPEAGGPTLVGALVDGRSSALFAVLAGAGLALADGGVRGPRGPAGRLLARIAVRAACVLAAGLAVTSLGPPVAVILQYYALLFLAVAPLVRLPAAALAALAGGWLVLAPVASHALRAATGLAGPGPQVDLAAALADPGGALVTLLLTGYYPVLPWLGYLLAGAAVGRLALTAARWPLTLGAVGLGLAVAAPAVSAALLRSGGSAALAAAPDLATGRSPDGPLFGTTPTTTWWWLAVDTPHSGTPLDLLGTTGSALLVVAGCLLLARTPARRLLAPLAAAGSMTLTLYLGHVVALAAGLPPLAGPGVWLVHAAAALAVASVWRAWLARGPVEQAVAWVVDTVAGPAHSPAGEPPSGERASRTA